MAKNESICDDCKGTVVKKKVAYTLYGINLGEFPAEVCTKCGEIIFDEKASKEIEKASKEKGLFGMGLRTKVGKAGNSLDIRIGKQIAQFTGLKQGETVTVIPESKNKIAIYV